MKWFIRFTIFILFGPIYAFMASCSKEEPDIPEPTPDTVRRTVLVYMIATNNLSSFANADIREMVKGSAAGAVASDARWIIYYASYNDNPKLIEFVKGEKVVLKEYDSNESATYGRMTEVFDDVASLAPALNYGLVLWSHGSGWVVNGIEENLPFDPYKASTLSFGDDYGKKMNIATLRAAVKGRNFDYIYFDVCHMNTVEVAYELRDAVRFLVGSPAETPAEGMQYETNMAPLSDGSLDALIQAAKNTFEEYEYQRTSIMSVIDTQHIERLADATAAIYALTPLEHPAENVTNYYGTTRYARFIDFGEYVTALATNSELEPALLEEFDEALSHVVIYSEAPSMFYSPNLKRFLPIYTASGLSTYVFNNPSSFTTDSYNTLQWAQDVVVSHLH